jgi:large conductance mechanosensitive channel
MRKFFRDFRTFIQRGNVLDLATGIIIGGAFNTIVKSLVNDILMPIIGLIGGKNISEASLVLVPAVTNEAGEVLENAVTLNYGLFFQAIIDFLIVAFTIFIIIKAATSFQRRMEALRRKKEKETPPEADNRRIAYRNKRFVEKRNSLGRLSAPRLLFF